MVSWQTRLFSGSESGLNGCSVSCFTSCAWHALVEPTPPPASSLRENCQIRLAYVTLFRVKCENHNWFGDLGGYILYLALSSVSVWIVTGRKTFHNYISVVDPGLFCRIRIRWREMKTIHLWPSTGSHLLVQSPKHSPPTPPMGCSPIWLSSRAPVIQLKKTNFFFTSLMQFLVLNGII